MRRLMSCVSILIISCDGGSDDGGTNGGSAEINSSGLTYSAKRDFSEKEAKRLPSRRESRHPQVSPGWSSSGIWSVWSIQPAANDIFPLAESVLWKRCSSFEKTGKRAKDFKEFIRLAGMNHVRTAPYYPQSNAKKERWHHTLKSECIRPGMLLLLEAARTVVGKYPSLQC